MKQPIFVLLLIAWALPFLAPAQITNVVVLNAEEAGRLQTLIREHEGAKQLYDSIAAWADSHWQDQPRPLPQLFYEGLLPTNPDRINTRKSLEDVDKVVSFMYASYGSNNPVYAQKAAAFITAWAAAYHPDGNPINENKFVPLFWAYYLFKDQFSTQEKKKVEAWMRSIAKAEMERSRTPNNNWEAKRLKIIGTVGCIVGDEALKEEAVQGLKAYISTAYYPDGSSNDLKQRDALHYHISGITPTLSIFINCAPFEAAFDLYDYTAPSGASIRKSVEYTLPYATGELEREEWTNTKVALDKERAAAGLPEYQPGTLFDPKDALPLFEWAGYYNPAWYSLLGPGSAEENYAATWVGLLNSPLVRR